MSKKKRMPTKAELIQLQKLYKTDEKIGERLGGVPAYLVAYWRRKKNVPRHSMPKFSEREIRSLWERYGDDDRCGLELGISKAAFYNWRRRYGIREKPAFLKLEQLELAFPGVKTKSSSQSLWGHQTLAQKLLARGAKMEKIEVGQEIEVEPDIAVAQHDTAAVIEEFNRLGAEYVWNSAKIVLASPQAGGASGGKAAEDGHAISEFVRRQRLKNHLDYSLGYVTQVAIESGFLPAGGMAVGTNRESTAFGSLASLGTSIDPKAMARLWATGKAALTVPESVRVDVSGRRPRGVYAKDIGLAILNQMKDQDLTGKAVEFYGSAISQMSVSERFTLTSMAAASGAMAAICQFDSNTRRFLTNHSVSEYVPLMTDKNAVYKEMYQINIDHFTSQVACPGDAGEIKPLAEVEEVPISTVVIGTACNGRFDDLRIAADIIKGNKVNPGCRLLVYPASRAVYLESLKKGHIRILAEAGAMILPPGFGAHSRIPLAEGERCLTTECAPLDPSARELVYVGSPATAAATAINAAITEPARYL